MPSLRRTAWKCTRLDTTSSRYLNRITLEDFGLLYPSLVMSACDQRPLPRRKNVIRGASTRLQASPSFAALSSSAGYLGKRGRSALTMIRASHAHGLGGNTAAVLHTSNPIDRFVGNVLVENNLIALLAKPIASRKPLPSLTGIHRRVAFPEGRLCPCRVGQMPWW
jgi:hypothetical protein